MGWSSSAVSALESPRRARVPSQETLALIAGICRVPSPTLHLSAGDLRRSFCRQPVHTSSPPTSLEKEIYGNGLVLASLTLPYRSVRRSAEIFLQRYADLDGARTLHAIGERHGITRERVRQILAAMLPSLAAAERQLRRERLDALLPRQEIDDSRADAIDGVSWAGLRQYAKDLFGVTTIG